MDCRWIDCRWMDCRRIDCRWIDCRWIERDPKRLEISANTSLEGHSLIDNRINIYSLIDNRINIYILEVFPNGTIILDINLMKNWFNPQKVCDLCYGHQFGDSQSIHCCFNLKPWITSTKRVYSLLHAFTHFSGRYKN